MRNYLEFENEIKTLEDELSRLKDPFHKEVISEVDTKSIEKIQEQINFRYAFAHTLCTHMRYFMWYLF